MAMVGRLTDSIYRRYAIVDEPMLKDAGVLLGLLDDATEQKRLAAAKQAPKQPRPQPRNVQNV
jgi:hypothetical protein